MSSSFQKILSCLLVLSMVPITTISGCQKSEEGDVSYVDPSDYTPQKPIVNMTQSEELSPINVVYDLTLADEQDRSQDVYWNAYAKSANLKEFNDYYTAALAQTDASSRYAVMALAEAKFLESGAYIPTTTKGGKYAMGRVAPHTNSSILWGNDMMRYHNTITTKQWITADDRQELQQQYAKLKGTGRYENYCKWYLATHGYTLKNSLTNLYTTDPQTWDILATHLASDSRAIINTVDGLIEYDCEGRMMPALATSYEVSSDGMQYTFHIRPDVDWVTRSGTPYAKVTASDWVTGLKHLLDSKGGTEYLLKDVILNAEEYLQGKITDFSKVGVCAVDETTLQYTLTRPCSYFLTMLNYNPFTPLNESFFKSQGTRYGTSPDHILYCGPYLVSNATAQSKIVYKLNPYYWNKQNVVNQTINWFYDDGADATQGYKQLKNGTIDSVELNSSTIELAKNDKLFQKYYYITPTDATSYGMFSNVNRTAYSTVGVDMDSSKNDKQKLVAKMALTNQNFRLALAYGFDRASYNAVQVGEDCKLFNMTNTYTPGNFVQLQRDITITVNGISKTFSKGTYYGKIVQAQLEADEYPIRVWDNDLQNGQGGSIGFDGWYDPEEACAQLQYALLQFQTQGVVITEKDPIILDYPYLSSNSVFTARANALKQAYESLFDRKVIINLVPASKNADWLKVGYYATAGNECNFDMYDCTGWGPDFGDPQTYLASVSAGDGSMTRLMGLY